MTNEPKQETFIRALDILLSALAIVIGFPLFLIIFILGMLDNGSPLFFQTRVGKGQRPFTLIKFRTMELGTDSVGTHAVDANAVTNFGCFLRRTKLDELPQLINVLLGHMSLVGPRPCLTNQTELIHEREKRGAFKVRPGISGLAQINNVDMSTPRKLARYDQVLIKHICPRVYGKIIIATALGRGLGDRVRKISKKQKPSYS
jgi:lipopolysaccharide/colanic/teichoic acid biosynthesis glycosyltransferase